jgi:glutamyl-tRNA synthetase
MNNILQEKIAHILTDGHVLPSREGLEQRYPSRLVPEGTEVTRLCPSPTGFVHIGTIFTAMLCQYVARQSNGVYMLRIEDTDKKREVEGAKQLITEQLALFQVKPDEGLQPDGTTVGAYGPYVQSERSQLYLSFALELLRAGRAYPCFATSDELAAAVADQQSKKQRPGYYGEWALWRDRSDEEVEAALVDGKSFVLRFKSLGSHLKRVQFDDVLKGHMELPENDLDVPLIKSDEYRLPTYHLAHVVDDYLMRATIIMRGEEWLPSTPLHLELADALNIPRFRYAHTPVISILDPNGGGKRKLSKRKDPEADVAFWLKQAYPLKAIKAYLLGLANSNFEDWYREHSDANLSEFPFSLERLKTSRSPLLDMKKVEDYAKDEIARMSQEHFNKEILAWCEVHYRTLFDAMTEDPEYTKKVLAIERDGEKPRKDVAKWSDAPEQFGYFYDDIFELNILPTAQCENEAAFSDEVQEALDEFLKNYDHRADKDTWFENMKNAAVEAGYCLDRKELKENPDKYKGGIADFAGVIRLNLTGKSRTPDLWTIMQIMGEQRVKTRLGVETVTEEPS